VGRVVQVHGSPSEVLLAFGSLWVVSHRGATITRIDPATGAVQAFVSSPRSHLVSVGASGGHVWTLSSDAQTLEGVNAATNTQDVSVRVHSDGGGTAAAGDGVWFAGTSGRVMHIRAGRIVRSIRIADKGSYLTPWRVGRRLFIADANAGRLTLLDAETGRVERTLQLGGDLAVFASTHGAVWLGARSGPLWRLDQHDPAVRKTMASGPVDHLAMCRGLLWVRVDATSVVGLDPVTGDVAKRYDELPASEIPGGGIACARGALWVVNWSDGSVWQIPLG
jgi:streptogramin lyase